MPPRTATLLLLAVVLLLSAGTLAAGPVATATRATGTATASPAAGTAAAENSGIRLSPEPVELGDTQQRIHITGDVRAEPTALVINVTPLADAGADLSAATVEVVESDGVAADPAIERTGGSDETVLVRVALDPTNGSTESTGSGGPDGSGGSTDVRLELALEGIDTADAEPTRLRYGAAFGGEPIEESEAFRIRDPGMPQISEVISPGSLVVGEQAASQRTRLILFDVPADTRLTVRVDLEALTAANVSLAEADASARTAEGVDVRGVERNGTTVTLDVRTGGDDRVAVELVLTGVDTRGAEPTTGLRYGIAVEAPAGTATGESEAFGVYRPGESPTSTPTPVPSPTKSTSTTPGDDPTPTPADGTPTRTAGSTAEGTGRTDTATGTDTAVPGFGVATAALAGLVAVAVVRLVRDRRGS